MTQEQVNLIFPIAQILGAVLFLLGMLVRWTQQRIKQDREITTQRLKIITNVNNELIEKNKEIKELQKELLVYEQQVDSLGKRIAECAITELSYEALQSEYRELQNIIKELKEQTNSGE